MEDLLVDLELLKQFVCEELIANNLKRNLCVLEEERLDRTMAASCEH